MAISLKYTAYARHARVLKMRLYIAVGIGGMIGASLRFLLSSFILFESFGSLPLATFFVNITGAFILTFITFSPAIKNAFSKTTFTALTTGLIGSYTTFSTIIVEAIELSFSEMNIAILYIIGTVLFGLLASLLGIIAATKMTKERGES